MSKKPTVALAALITAFALTALFTAAGYLDALNHSLAEAVQSLEAPALTAFMIAVTTIGEWFVYAPAALLLLVIPKTRRKIGLPVTLTLAASAALNVTLKMLFAIPRPDAHRLIAETGYGFPSGHAMNSTAFVGICVFLFIRGVHKYSQKVFIVCLSVLFLLLMGLSRVYLGVHNPTDILGGYLAGFIILASSIMVIEKKHG
ncbi:phosphatase PAP2 family protein [Clostridia bacterium]|nr:phosphatase PAP2 family protein [Clostridia bacterium]